MLTGAFSFFFYGQLQGQALVSRVTTTQSAYRKKTAARGTSTYYQEPFWNKTRQGNLDSKLRSM